MPRTAFLLIPLLLASCRAFASDVPGHSVRRNLTFAVGERSLDDDEFPGIDEPTVYGLEFDAYRKRAALGIEAGLNYSTERDGLNPGKFEAGITQLYAGVRKTIEVYRPWFGIRPYVGGGVTLFLTRVRFEGGGSPPDDTETEWDTGLYGRLGVNVFFDDQIFFGVDYMRVFEESFDSGGFDLDQSILTFRIGWSF